MQIMRTIQMTIDEKLLDEVDKAVNKLGTTRSAFIRQSLEKSIQQLKIEELERKQIEGYLRHPVQPGEFDAWIDEQDWETL
jgi:metal-responsive CopG/Arc/MetJ family transcriptional regulator